MNKLSTLLAVTTLQAYAEEGKKCRALVLSGGSHNGAWEAGVVWGLLHYGNPADFAWDVISGVSAGALNTGLTATFATGDEYAMSEALSDMWANIQTNDQLYVPRGWSYDEPAGALYAFLNYNSIMDTTPMLEYLTETYGQYGDIKRRWITAAIDANTGDYVTMDQTNCSVEDLPTCALASGSIPIAAPPQLWKGYVLADGGTVWDLNIDGVISQCLDGIVDDPADIIIDVVVCYYRPLARPQVVSKNAFTNWQESRDIMSLFKETIAIGEEVRDRQDIDYRYYFQERIGDQCAYRGRDLDFRNSTTWCLQEVGRNDANTMLNLGQEKIHGSLEEWYDSEELRVKFPQFRDYLDTFINLF